MEFSSRSAIDHHPRGGEKFEFVPNEAERFKKRTTVERANARLKDEFGGRFIRVRGHAKVMAHLMFWILALTADKWLRLIDYARVGSGTDRECGGVSIAGRSFPR